MIEDSIKKHSCYSPAQDNSSSSESSYMTIPYALVVYTSTVLYNTYQVLENQLSQVDPGEYEELEQLAQRVFDSWVTLGYREGGANGVRV